MEPEWNSVKCVLCAEDTGGGKSALTTHLAKHLEEISLSALPAGVGSYAPSEQGDAVLSNSVSEQENSPASIKQSPRMTILDWKKSLAGKLDAVGEHEPLDVEAHGSVVNRSAENDTARTAADSASETPLDRPEEADIPGEKSDTNIAATPTRTETPKAPQPLEQDPLTKQTSAMGEAASPSALKLPSTPSILSQQTIIQRPTVRGAPPKQKPKRILTSRTVYLWFCCQCLEGPYSVDANVSCTNPNCRPHVRCGICRVERHRIPIGR